MSYILDALKKSDEKRMAALQSKPVQLAEPRRSGSPHAGWFLMLAVVALLAASWLFSLFQRDQAAQTTLPATLTSNSLMPAQTAMRTMQKPMARPSGATVNHTETILPGIAPASTPAMPHTSEITQTISQSNGSNIAHRPLTAAPVSLATPITPMTPVAIATPTTDPVAAAPATDAQATASAIAPAAPDIPPRSELPVTIQQALPKIRIEAHIYDAMPSARMVIINGHMLREDQSLEDGLILEAITETGIILDYQGTRFRMGVFDR